MKISIDRYILVDEANPKSPIVSESVSSWKNPTGTTVQEVTGVRLEKVRYIPRANRQGKLSITVIRQHANPNGAHAFCLVHKATLPESGDVTITFNDETRTYIPEAVILSSGDDVIVGSSTTHDYVIHGHPQKTKPL